MNAGLYVGTDDERAVRWLTLEQWLLTEILYASAAGAMHIFVHMSGYLQNYAEHNELKTFPRVHAVIL